MNNLQRIAAGAGVAVFVTGAAMVAPGGMVSADQNDRPAGVERPIPSPGVKPFPAKGTVPVVAPSPARSAESASGASKNDAGKKTRKSAASAPYASPSAVRAEARSIAQHASTLTRTSTAPKPVYIKGYSFCGWTVREAQRCIDQGKLTRYKPAGVNTLAGHNYMGWYWIDDIPTGRIVIIQSGKLAGKYKVYGHAKVYNGQFPKSGLGAAVALQTCEGSGIGFSFLRRA